MNVQSIITAVVAAVLTVILATIVIGVGRDGMPGRDGKPGIGGFAGPEIFDSLFLSGGASYGSGCFATSTTGTLTATQLEKNSCLYITAAGAGQAVLSLTLPSASSTNNVFLPKDGMCRDFFIDASDVAAATTTTIVAGTNVDLVGLDATGAGTGADVIDGGEYGKLTLCRQTGDRVTAYVQEYLNAD